MSEAVPVPQSFATPRYRFVVLHTPGHSDDHICLLEPDEGWLFDGDLLLSEKVQMLPRDEDAGQILTSLHRLLDYDIKAIFCAFGRVVTEGRQALAAKIAF